MLFFQLLCHATTITFKQFRPRERSMQNSADNEICPSVHPQVYCDYYFQNVCLFERWGCCLMIENAFDNMPADNELSSGSQFLPGWPVGMVNAVQDIFVEFAYAFARRIVTFMV